MSRQHVAIEFAGDGFRVRDLGSSEGLLREIRDANTAMQVLTLALQARLPLADAVAVVHGADAISDARLATLLRNDPATEVRAAAVANLLRRSRLDALEDATPALFDPEGAVRGEAALQIAALGPEVVPTLAALVPGRTAEDLTGVLTALRWAGDNGVSVLQDIIDNHPDKRVRNLALVTLGRAPRH